MPLKKWLQMFDDERSIPCGKIMVADFHACKSNAHSVVPNAFHGIFLLLTQAISPLDILPFHFNGGSQHFFKNLGTLFCGNRCRYPVGRFLIVNGWVVEIEHSQLFSFGPLFCMPF